MTPLSKALCSAPAAWLIDTFFGAPIDAEDAKEKWFGAKRGSARATTTRRNAAPVLARRCRNTSTGRLVGHGGAAWLVLSLGSRCTDTRSGPRGMVKHEEGFIVCCSLCDSYFVLTTGLVAPAAWRGHVGGKTFDARNEKLQERWAKKRWALLRCPTCVECVTGLPFLDWLERFARDVSHLTPLSPCWLVSFEGELPPLYLDQKPAGEAGKPKWKLVSGVGPAGLELDSSKSGRIWKPSLRAAGIDAPRYDGASASSGHHHDVLRRVETALQALGERADALAECLHAAKPVYQPASWTELCEQVDAVVSAEAEAAREAERIEREGWSNKRRRQRALDELEEACVGGGVASAAATLAQLEVG